MTPSPAVCDNCGNPAVSVWTLDDGSEATACERCRPESGVSVRAVGARPTAAITPDAPLTVAEAAERAQVSKSTIQRWLASGELQGGAWRTSEGAGTWRIDPVALDRRRAQAATTPSPPPAGSAAPPEPAPPEPKPVAKPPGPSLAPPERKPVTKPPDVSPAPPQAKPVANPTDWPRRP